MLKFTVTAFKSPLEAVKVLEKEEFDLVLMNLDMHEMGGKNFMQVTRQIQLPTIGNYSIDHFKFSCKHRCISISRVSLVVK